RITLSDGTVVASSDPNQITNPTARELPHAWKRVRLLDDALPTPGPGQLAATQRLTVSDRGDADLEITAPVAHPPHTGWETQAGVGAFGAVAMIVLLLV